MTTVRTQAQADVAAVYRNMRPTRTPFVAATAVRDAYALVIARWVADGITPPVLLLDRFRAAEQWVATVLHRDYPQPVDLGRAS